MQLAIHILRRIPGLTVLLVGMFIIAYALKSTDPSIQPLRIEALVTGVVVLVLGVMYFLYPDVGQKSSGSDSGNRILGVLFLTGLGMVLGYLAFGSFDPGGAPIVIGVVPIPLPGFVIKLILAVLALVIDVIAFITWKGILREDVWNPLQQYQQRFGSFKMTVLMLGSVALIWIGIFALTALI